MDRRVLARSPCIFGFVCDVGFVGAECHGGVVGALLVFLVCGMGVLFSVMFGMYELGCFVSLVIRLDVDFYSANLSLLGEPVSMYICACCEQTSAFLCVDIIVTSFAFQITWRFRDVVHVLGDSVRKVYSL